MRPEVDSSPVAQPRLPARLEGLREQLLGDALAATIGPDGELRDPGRAAAVVHDRSAHDLAAGLGDPEVPRVGALPVQHQDPPVVVRAPDASLPLAERILDDRMHRARVRFLERADRDVLRQLAVDELGVGPHPQDPVR